MTYCKDRSITSMFDTCCMVLQYRIWGNVSVLKNWSGMFTGIWMRPFWNFGVNSTVFISNLYNTTAVAQTGRVTVANGKCQNTNVIKFGLTRTQKYPACATNILHPSSVFVVHLR
jgi:hypothetical protein